MPRFLTTDEIRQRYLDFFVSQGHKLVASDSLAPANDPSVLFTGAGMNQFKDHFAGAAKLDHPQQRATTCQKCVRAGDIENVGRTASHHTFFEMLGNFSFGDYFKEEAIQWAVAFCTDPERGLGLEPERLSVTVFKGDEALGIPPDEDAIRFWQKHAPWLKDKAAKKGIVKGWRIYGYGEHDNFWPADAPSKGPNGVCGPCSEIYYDVHPAWQEPTSKPPAPEPVAEDGARYVEIWNLVFTQFNRVDMGKLEPLPAQNIDTGAGLERMARVIQGKQSNFEIDLLLPIVTEVAALAGQDYHTAPFEAGRRMRRITDHVRMAVFAISDGVNPENLGRNYVVRRLIRRAILDGHELGIQDAFLGQVAAKVIQQMKTGYPELVNREKQVQLVLQGEERAFQATLSRGRTQFEKVLQKLKASGRTEISGEEAFDLYSTYGFPIELTEESAVAEGVRVDADGFRRALDAAAGTAAKGDIFQTGPIADLKKKYKGQATRFRGYDTLDLEGCRVLEIVSTRDGEPHSLVESSANGTVLLLLDQTPFYAESGGQVGDTGALGAHRVLDTQKQEGLFLHTVELTGPLKVGEMLRAVVAPEHRQPVLKNHSATHLLQLALRRTLGTHVEQRGSVVDPGRLRFDFTHFEALKADEIREIERLVNEQIQADHAVKIAEMPIGAAKQKGAMALFGEKYGDVVRVVEMGPSVELCGGTHVERTGQIGYFKVVAESSISAGVRRVEALTGQNAVRDARATEEALGRLAQQLKTSKDTLAERLAALQDEAGAAKRELEALKKAAASGAAEALASQAKPVAGVPFLAVKVDGADGKGLRDALDGIRKQLQDGVVVLAGDSGGKAALLVHVEKNLTARVKAGDLLKTISPLVDGRGGGRPDLAQGGGANPGGIPAALAAAEKALAEALG